MAPGEKETLDIGFKAPAEGLYHASLIIETNLPDRYRQVIPLSRIGIEVLPTPSPEPTSTPEATPTLTPKPTPTDLPWTVDLRFESKITTVSLDTTLFQSSLMLDLPDDTL